MFPQAIIGLLVLIGAALWILADLEVRTLRSVALLLVAVLIGGILAVNLAGPAGYIGGAVIACLIALPVLTHHPWISAFRPADTAMMRELRDAEHRLVAAGNALAHGGIDAAEYRHRLSNTRDSIRALKVPDPEWEAVILAVSRDIDRSLAFALKGGGADAVDEIKRRRAFVRNESLALLRRRRTWI
jgi:hypothetical protein